MIRTWSTATAISLLLGVVALTGMSSSAWAAPAWLAQFNLSATNENASVSDVAMNPGGDVVVTWQGSVAGSVYVSHRPAGGGFSAPLQLASSGFDVLGTPQAAIDGDGDAVVVWQEPDGLSQNTLVRAAFRPAGGSFGVPVRVSGPDMVAVHPQVAMNAAGDIVVSWWRYLDQGAVVQASVRPAGGAFSAPADLFAGGAQGPDQRVAIDAAGNATVVWAHTAAEGMTVKAATRPAGGTFSTPTNLSATGPTGGATYMPGQVFEPEVATNAAGETVATWTRVADGGNWIVQAATRPAGGTFSAPVDVSVADHNASDAQVAIDAVGNAVVVWTRFDDPPEGIVQVAQRPSGGSFTAPSDVSLPAATTGAARVAVNAAGDAVVAWQQSNGTRMIVRAIVRRAGATFAAPTNLSGAGGDATEPQVGIDADGDAIAAWRRTDGSATILQAAAYDGAGPQLRGLSIPAAVTAGVTATYSLSPLDVWSTVASTTWSFDDGASPTGPSVSHAFATSGEHTVTVRSTDALGNATTATRPVTVTPSQEPATPPPAPAPSAPPPPPSPPAAAISAPPPPASAPTNRFVVQAASATPGGVIRLVLRAPVAGTYRAVATIRRSRTRTFAYGRGRATARRGGRVVLTIRPALGAKRRLSARGRRVTVAVTFKPTTGTARTKRLGIVVKAKAATKR